jgi:type II secretory pathway component PulF
MKSLIWCGVVIAALGLVVLSLFVVPHIAEQSGTGLNGLPQASLQAWAVLTSSVGLAVGAVLIGVGVGRWQHPRHTHTMPLGQTHDGTEI